MKQTKILQETWKVEPRLLSLGLTRAGLIKVIQASVMARAECTSNDPVNAEGWFGYSYGVRALRDAFCPEGWKIDRTDSIEGIFHPEKIIKVAFLNGDSAADSERNPQPRSKKGAGTERATRNNQYCLNLVGGKINSGSSETPSIWYLIVCVVGDEVCAELSLPNAVKDGRFTGFIERLFIVGGGDWGEYDMSGFDEDDEQEIEVTVVRK